MAESGDLLVLGNVPDGIRMLWENSVTTETVLTGERYAHCLVAYPEMLQYVARLPEIIIDPDEVHRNKKGARVAILYKSLDDEYYVRVALWMSFSKNKKNSVHSYRKAK